MKINTHHIVINDLFVFIRVNINPLQRLVRKVLDMSQTCQKVSQMSEIFDSNIEVFNTEQFFVSKSQVDAML